MKLMPVGVGGARNVSPTKGTAAIVKTVSAAQMKPYLTNRSGGKRPLNFSVKSPQNRANFMTLNSRLLLRPQELAIHPNSNLPPNAVHQAANQVRQEFRISGTNRRISGQRIVKQHIEVKIIITLNKRSRIKTTPNQCKFYVKIMLTFIQYSYSNTIVDRMRSSSLKYNSYTFNYYDFLLCLVEVSKVYY